MIKKAFSTLLSAVLCLTLLLGCFSTAQAEDYFNINIDVLDMDSLNSNEYVTRHLSSQSQGISVSKYISDSSELAVPVRLTLVQTDSNTLLFDKDYGYQSGTFDSGVIYLPYVDSRTIPYLVTLYVADYTYAMPFMHLMPRLEYNGASTYGLRLRDIAPGLYTDWLMGTMIDLDALRLGASQSIDICASNAYIIGQANVWMQGDSVCVDTSFYDSANVQINTCSLYMITNCSEASNGASASQFPAYSLGQSIDVSGASSALLYMPMQVSYNTDGLSTFTYSASSSQQALWQSNIAGGASQSYAQDDYAGDIQTDSSGWDTGSGWDDNSGWDSGTGWDDNSGWDSGSGWDDNSGWDSGSDDDFFDNQPIEVMPEDGTIYYDDGWESGSDDWSNGW